MTWVQKIPHFIRFSLSLGLFLLAYMSGLFFKSEPIGLGDVFSEEASAESRRQIVQVYKEEIVYKKVERATSLQKSVSSPGAARQIGENTWTVQVASDSRLGTVGEVLLALNTYRQRHGKNALSWDTQLAEFAQSRANAFSASGSTDSHAGFQNLINNQNGFQTLGFMALGENSSFGYQLEAVNLIEKVYAADAPHNDNQLNAQWSHVGVGVSGVATDLVFGGRKM